MGMGMWAWLAWLALADEVRDALEEDASGATAACGDGRAIGKRMEGRREFRSGRQCTQSQLQCLEEMLLRRLEQDGRTGVEQEARSGRPDRRAAAQ